MNLSQKLVLQTNSQFAQSEKFNSDDKENLKKIIFSPYRDTYILEEPFVFCDTPLIKELYCEPLFIKALFNKIVEYSILPLTNNILYEISLNVPLEKFYNQEIVLDKLLNDDQIFGCFCSTSQFFTFFKSPLQEKLINKFLKKRGICLSSLTKLPISTVEKILANEENKKKIGQELIKNSSGLNDDEELAILCWSIYKDELNQRSLTDKINFFTNLPTESLKKEAFAYFKLSSYLQELTFSGINLEKYLSQDELLEKALHQIPFHNYKEIFSSLDWQNQFTFLKHLSGREQSEFIRGSSSTFKIETLEEIFKRVPSILNEKSLELLYNKNKDSKYLLELKNRYLTLEYTSFLPDIIYNNDFVNLLSEEEKQIIIDKYNANGLLLPTHKENYNDYFFKAFTKKSIAYLKENPDKIINISMENLLSNYTEKERLEIVKHFDISTIINQIISADSYIDFYQKILAHNPNFLKERSISSRYSLFDTTNLQNINIILPYLSDEQITLLYQPSILKNNKQILAKYKKDVLNHKYMIDEDCLIFFTEEEQKQIFDQLTVHEIFNLANSNIDNSIPNFIKIVEEKLNNIIDELNNDKYSYILYSGKLLKYLDSTHQRLLVEGLTNLWELSNCLINISNNENLQNVVLDRIIKVYENNITIDSVLSYNKTRLKFANYDTKTLNYILNNLSFGALFHTLGYFKNEIIIKEIMSRLRKNGEIIFDEKIFDNFEIFIYLLNNNDRDYLTKFINKRFSSYNIYETKYKQNFPKLSLLEKINFINLANHNLIGENNALFDQLLDKNPFLLNTARQIIFHPALKEMDYRFLEKISKYPDMEQKLTKLAEMNALNFLTIVSKNFKKNNYSPASFDMGMSILIDFLSSYKDFQHFNFSVINNDNVSDIINYIFYESYQNQNKSVQKGETYYKSINEMYSFKITNFTEERINKCDELFTKTKDLEELKNIYLNKYLSMSLTEAKTFLKSYAQNYYKVAKYAQNDAPTKYIEILSSIININDVVTIKELYETTNFSYDMNDRFTIENTIKNAYHNSIIEEYKAKHNGTKVTKKIKKADGEEVSLNMTEYFDNFGIIVHSTCAYNKIELLDNDYFTSWNKSPFVKNHGICCSYITNSNYSTAAVTDTGVMFGFTDLKKESLSVYSPYDLATFNSGYNIKTTYEPYYTTLEDVPSYTRHTHNEFNLERKDLSSDAKHFCLQPNAIVIMEDMPDSIKANSIKAYEDFKKHGIELELIYIDRLKIAKNEANKIANLLTSFEENYDLPILKEIINLYESNICSSDFLDNINKDELFVTSRINEMLYKTLEYIKSQENKETQVTLLNDFINILLGEQFKFDLINDLNTSRAHKFNLYTPELKEEIAKIKEQIMLNNSYTKKGS